MIPGWSQNDPGIIPEKYVFGQKSSPEVIFSGQENYPKTHDFLCEIMLFCDDFLAEKYNFKTRFFVEEMTFRDDPRISLGPSRDHPGIILSSF